MVNTEYNVNAVLRSCSLRCHKIILSNQGAGASGQFIVNTSIGGRKCRVLYDTGASTCFVQAGHALLESSSPCSDLNGQYTSGGLQVCLGDGSVVATQGCVRLSTTVGGKQYAWDFHAMNLPTGIDIIVGMDFMTFHDVALLVADKRVLFGDTLLSMGSSECQTDPSRLEEITCRMHDVASETVSS